MRIICILLFICCSMVVRAQHALIIPEPVKTTINKGSFTISNKTAIVATDDAEKHSADFLNAYLKEVYGFSLPVQKDAKSNYIKLNTRKFVKAPDNEGRYTMEVTPVGISIEGDTYQGTFYGLQSLIQLLPVKKSTSLKVRAISVEDYPRFQYRGLHLDVGRHMFPLEFIKKYIDYIALHKMNYFHWHLTEDQGWRIEIKKYPELTEVGGFRNGTIIGRYPGKGNDNIRYGGFYTQDEVKEVVDYAAKRYITVVPEIELPGHASAAIAAFPWLSCFPEQKTHIPENMISEASKRQQAEGRIKLVQETWGVFDDVFCAGNDSTFAFLQNVLDEVIPLFPSKYVHIGGDESPKTHWEKCPRCQKRIKDLNLKDEHELQSYFIQRMEKYINSKGKTIIGWDEILEGGLAPNAIVMSWRGEEGGIEAARQNHDVIMTPGSHVYFDHSQTRNEDSVTIGGYTTVQKVYSYEPVPKELSEEHAKHVLGAQANVWTEYIKNIRKVEYHIFPRVSALSEVLWTPKEKKEWKNFEKKLQDQFKRYELWGANYSRAYFDLKASILPSKNGNGVLLKFESDSKNGVIQYTTNEEKSNLKKYTTPIVVNKDGEFGATFMVNGKPNSWTWQKFSINKATGKKISLTKEPSNYYPGNGGAFGLINGLRSDKGLNSIEWLGWTSDVEAVVDLGKPTQVQTVSLHVLDQNGSWIYFPSEFEVFVSNDGKDFKSLGATKDVQKLQSGMGNMQISFDPTQTRYIKLLAKTYGKIPEGKAGAGRNAWVFVDEIQIN